MADTLPQIMLDELAKCPRVDCSIRAARGDTGLVVHTTAQLLECTTCNQIWEVEAKAFSFTHWDKTGNPHGNVDNEAYTITSKWPKGESQVESVGGTYGIKKRKDNAIRKPAQAE